MEKDGKQFVNKAQFAKLMDFDRSNLSKADVLKRLQPAIETDDKGRVWIDPVLGKQIIDRERDTAKVRKAAATALPAPAADLADSDEDGVSAAPAGSMDAARRKNIDLKNEDLALALAEKKGQTCHRPKVVGAGAMATQMVRESLFAMVPGLAEQFATMTDARQIRSVMDGALRNCLENLHNDFTRRIQPAAGVGSGGTSTH